jgi:hypothetical protein
MTFFHVLFYGVSYRIGSGRDRLTYTQIFLAPSASLRCTFAGSLFNLLM